MNRKHKTARSVAAVAFGLLAGLATGAALDHRAPEPMPACATEDAPGPCRWDATERGDGGGRSFVVLRDGRVIYDDDSARA